jgi:hypothetical protein
LARKLYKRDHLHATKRRDLTGYYKNVCFGNRFLVGLLSISWLRSGFSGRLFESGVEPSISSNKGLLIEIGRYMGRYAVAQSFLC